MASREAREIANDFVHRTDEVDDLARAIDELRVRDLERAVRLCETEGAAYIANSKECDAAGNYQSGTSDLHGASGCDACAKLIFKQLTALRAAMGEKKGQP